MQREAKLGPIVFIFAILAGVGGVAWSARADDVDARRIRPGVYVVDKDHAKLNWATSHFGFSTYSGEFTAFDARLALDPTRPERSSLAVTIDARSIETNNDRLDEHLQAEAFFDAETYPTAEFRSTRVLSTGPVTARVYGDLTLRGVTRPVELDVELNGAGENPVSKAYTVGFTALTIIDRTEFGVSAYAPAVGKYVKLTINGEFNPVTP